MQRIRFDGTNIQAKKNSLKIGKMDEPNGERQPELETLSDPIMPAWKGLVKARVSYP